MRRDEAITTANKVVDAAPRNAVEFADRHPGPDSIYPRAAHLRRPIFALTDVVGLYSRKIQIQALQRSQPGLLETYTKILAGGTVSRRSTTYFGGGPSTADPDA